MQGLDTNVLVRYITQDDPGQAETATRVIEDAADHGQKLMIHPLVLCELVWVLESAYGFAKSDILNVLELILRTSQFEIIDKDIAWKALDSYHNGKGDFADYLLGHAFVQAGADNTLTFDNALKGHRLFALI